MRFWRDLGIRGKILLALLPILMPVMAIIWVGYASSRDSSVTSGERLTNVILQNGAGKLNAHLAAQAEIFRNWSSEDIYGISIEFDTTEELAAHFEEMLAVAPGFTQLLLTDTDGGVIRAYPPVPSGSREPAASDLTNRLPIHVTDIVSEVLAAAGNDHARTYLFSYPCKNTSDEVNGLLLAYLDWSAVQQQVEAVGAALRESGFPGAYAAILDTQSGTALGHADRTLVGTRLDMPEAVLAWRETVEHAGLTAPFDMPRGREYASFARVTPPAALRANDAAAAAASPYDLLVFVPENNLLAEARRILRANLIMAGIILVLLVATILFVGGRIAAPIRRTVEFAKAVAAGDLSRRMHMEARDEVGVLTAALDGMADNLLAKAEMAEAIAVGDLSREIELADGDEHAADKDVLGRAMTRMKEAIQRLADDTNALIEAAVAGRLDTRADADAHEGEFRRIVEGINKTVDTLVGNIEALPMPAMIIDRDYTIQYVNEAGSRLLEKSRESVLGGKCHEHFRTSHCGTAQCACAQAMSGDATFTEETDATPAGNRLEVSYTGVPMKNLEGKIIGAFECFTDQTEIKQAGRVARRQAEFQNAEVDKLIVNLEKVGRGDLTIETEVAEADDDTQAIRDDFLRINAAVDSTATAIRALVEDINGLSSAAQAGRLERRTEVERHQGEYREIVRGINETLDAILIPINEAAHVLEKLATRDLRARMTGDYRGDHARIKESLNKAVANLDDGLRQVAEVVDQVTSAGGQISTGSQAVAQGASEQASSLEEISSSMEEMAAMTKQNAASAREARGMAQGASGSADSGLDSMNRMSAAVERIKESADATAKIVKTIDDIAFQTNLLALNAAVEAARAGDLGKGFAVVAEEVRNLAIRSAEAAKNTANLIDESVQNAESGVSLNKEVLDKLKDIYDQASKVGEVMDEIAVSSEQQSTGIDQVNAALGQINTVTQHNAANSEESASAAQELSSQAENLRGLLQRFQITNVTYAKRGAAPAAADGKWDALPDAEAFIPFTEGEEEAVLSDF
ncbi:MAG: PAS domain-containing protein [Kiritimatiellae bacterium]|nr:PAS domain-containing protein [Kiritimatiellia bacterium]